MQIKSMQVIGHVLECGVPSGLRRFYKHREDAPDETTRRELEEPIVEACLDEFHTWFSFADERSD